MKAILSDIHGNLEALQAVLRDIESHNVREIYCLGDVMSHGPNPLDCLAALNQSTLFINWMRAGSCATLAR